MGRSPLGASDHAGELPPDGGRSRLHHRQLRRQGARHVGITAGGHHRGGDAHPPLPRPPHDRRDQRRIRGLRSGDRLGSGRAPRRRAPRRIHALQLGNDRPAERHPPSGPDGLGPRRPALRRHAAPDVRHGRRHRLPLPRSPLPLGPPRVHHRGPVARRSDGGGHGTLRARSGAGGHGALRRRFTASGSPPCSPGSSSCRPTGGRPTTCPPTRWRSTPPPPARSR